MQTFLTKSIYSRSRMYTSRFERNTYRTGRLVGNQHQFCSRRIDFTPTNYFLTRTSKFVIWCLSVSSPRSVFHPFSQMRRNTVTYWTTADFTNRQETCSFIRLNDAFRKTLLQAAKKKSRKSTDHKKKIYRARWFQIGLFNHTDRILGNDRDRRWGEGKMYKAASLAHESVMSAGAPHMPV